MVTRVSAAVQPSRAGLWTALAAALLLSGAAAGPAAAFGLGSIGDVVKGMNSPPAPPESTEHQEHQDDNGPPRPAIVSEPQRADAGQMSPEAARRHEVPQSPPQEQPASPPAAEPAPAATPVPPPAPAPVEAAKAPEPAPAAPAKPAMPATQTAQTPPLPQPTPDYYAERAKEVLAEEKKGRIKLHPIQTAAPDYDILLCEAGCDKPGLQILSKKPKTEAVSASDSSGKIKSAALSKGAECLGGCGYGNAGQAGSAPPAAEPAGEAGSWMTTAKERAGKIPEVAPVPAPSAVPAVPLEKSEAPPPATARPHPAHKAASKAAVSEDWMARINKERAAKKSSQAHSDGIGPVAPLKVETQ